MGFVPDRDHHALAEAVFGIEIDRPMQPREIEIIKAAHNLWREQLPRVNDIETHQFIIGTVEGLSPPQVVPAMGVVFERIKPDGTIAWRLTCNQSSILVNCLEYTTWSEIWPQALALMRKVILSLGETDLKIVNVMHQTVDMFRWEGSLDSYAATLLLDPQKGFVPQRIFNNGPEWHLYQGWFNESSDPVLGRILNRIHIDTLIEPMGSVRMDTYLRKDLGELVEISSLELDNGAIEKIFAWLHTENKEVLKNFLTEPILASINLGN